MNLKARVLILSILYTTFSCLQVFAGTPTLKAGLSYTLEKKQKIKLRITEIPSYGQMIERNEDWTVKLPKPGSQIIAENIDDIETVDSFGEKHLIPSGSKFYAKLLSSQKAKSFWRKEKVKIAFYKLEMETQEVNFEEGSFNLDSDKDVKTFQEGFSNIAKTGLYAVGGAIAGPIISFSITGLAGIGLLSNPYAIAGSSAIGAGLGLVYGIKRKGKNFDISPGSELKVELPNNWQVQKINKQKLASSSELKDVNSNFDLEILDVKKTKDEFGAKALQVSFAYDNRSGEELHYSSFKLIDSMGRDYYPSSSSMDFGSYQGLPRKAELELTFNTEFVKTRHELVVLKALDRKRLASSEVLLR